MGGAIDGSEANGIIRDPKLELENSRFTFDLVPFSYESDEELQVRVWFRLVTCCGKLSILLGRRKEEYECSEDDAMEFSEEVKMSVKFQQRWKRSKEEGYLDVEGILHMEAYTTKYSIHPGADTMLCGFRLTNRWLSMKKDIASCGSKYLAYSEVEVEYQGSSGLLLQPELPE
ncbi:hypothetical protein Tco_0642637 [Tanacetum coccineum]